MFKRKPKVLTPQEMEEIRTKDFFDCILPGTVKFLSDHYILGDNYCCVWVIREYPPSTDSSSTFGVGMKTFRSVPKHREVEKKWVSIRAIQSRPFQLQSE